MITCDPVSRKVPQPININDFKAISLKLELAKKVVLFIDCITITVIPIIIITTAPCKIKDTNCSMTADLLCLLPIEVAKTMGLMINKNKNSICLRATIMPLKNKAYKKKPPTIIAINQLIEYL